MSLNRPKDPRYGGSYIFMSSNEKGTGKKLSGRHISFVKHAYYQIQSSHRSLYSCKKFEKRFYSSSTSDVTFLQRVSKMITVRLSGISNRWTGSGNPWTYNTASRHHASDFSLPNKTHLLRYSLKMNPESIVFPR